MIHNCVYKKCVHGVYLVVVPEPFPVSQSWRGGVTGNLQNVRFNR